MTTIQMGSEAYRQLLREWGYWDRLARAGKLTPKNAARMAAVNASLQDAELSSKPINEVHSEGGEA